MLVGTMAANVPSLKDVSSSRPYAAVALQETLSLLDNLRGDDAVRQQYPEEGDDDGDMYRCESEKGRAPCGCQLSAAIGPLWIDRVRPERCRTSLSQALVGDGPSFPARSPMTTPPVLTATTAVRWPGRSCPSDRLCDSCWVTLRWDKKGAEARGG